MTDTKNANIKLAQTDGSDTAVSTTASNTPGNKDVLDQLREEGRNLRVAKILPNRELTIEEVFSIRDDFKRFLEKHELSQEQASRKLGPGYSPAYISTFVRLSKKDKFVTNLEEFARHINQWMEDYTRSLEVVRPDGWLPIRVAERMITLIQSTVRVRTMGAIYSDAGRGKTMTMQVAAQQMPQAIYIRVLRTTRTPSGLLRQLKNEMRIQANTAYDIQQKIIDALKGTERPLLIDEAQGLFKDSFEVLRDFHDVCGIPIVFAGTDDMDKTLKDNVNFYGQFFSRMSLKYDPRDELKDPKGGGLIHTEDDIRKLWCSGHLKLTAAAVRFLCQVANIEGYGGLRRCSRIVETAGIVSKGKQLTEKMLRTIVSQMHGIADSESIFTQLDKVKLAIA